MFSFLLLLFSVCFILARKESFESNKFSFKASNFFIMQDKCPFRFRFTDFALITLSFLNAPARTHYYYLPACLLPFFYLFLNFYFDLIRFGFVFWFLFSPLACFEIWTAPNPFKVYAIECLRIFLGPNLKG